MFFDWSETLKGARAIIHQTMGGEVMIDQGGSPFAITARYHDMTVVSGEQGGWAERFAEVPRLLLDSQEVTPARNNLITFSNGSTWRIVEVYPPRGVYIPCEVVEA